MSERKPYHRLPKGTLLEREATDELLAEISAFCFATGMAEGTFGERCCGNTALVKSLRLDRPRIYERTVIKVRRFIASNS